MNETRRALRLLSPVFPRRSTIILTRKELAERNAVFLSERKHKPAQELAQRRVEAEEVKDVGVFQQPEFLTRTFIEHRSPKS